MQAFRCHTDTYVIFAVSPEALRRRANWIREELREELIHDIVPCEMRGAAAEALAEHPDGAIHINTTEATREQLRAFPL